MAASKYCSTMLCRGDCKEYKPCQHIKDCRLCIMICEDENFNEKYIIGLGQNSLLCKRDNPNFKPYTVHQFIEAYKQMPLPFRTNVSIGQLLESGIADGTIVKE